MNPEYKALRGVAEKLNFRFKDICDDKVAAGGVASDIREIIEDFEMNKNPRSIEDRVKRIIEDLKELRKGDGQTMDAGHINELVEQYEDFRVEIRGLSNY